MTSSGTMTRHDASAYRATVVGIYLLTALVIAIACVLSIGRIRQDITNVAHERGAALFRLIEITRDWNALHGGVYVPVDENTQPNPYLKHPRRDITSSDGRRLTLVNPAFMTRQISELAERADGAKFHITSAKPIRPANQADAWETESLALFERTKLKERLDFFADGGGVLDGPAHRYMAPLLVKPACMPCHEEQGYRIGDVRGGISVTMPAASLMALGEQRRQQAVVLYLVAFGLIAGLGHLVAWRTRRHLLTLAEVNRRQELLIAERTRDLSAANGALATEVEELNRARVALDAAQARYRSVIDSSQDGIVVLEKGRAAFVNERMGEIVGHRPEELLGHELLDWVAPADRDWFAQRQQRYRTGPSVADEYRLRLLHRDGVTLKHCDVQLRGQTDGQGLAMLVANFKDMSDKLEAEKERLVAAAVFDSTAEGIFVTNHDNLIVRVNPAFCAITGYTPAEVMGHNPRLLKSGRHDKAFYAQLWQQLNEFGRWDGEIWNRRKSGEIYVAWLAITTIRGDAGEGRHVATFVDITQRKQAEEIILHRANFDALTDLPNRSLFDDRLVRVLASARRHQRSFALMYLDLDHFKVVNDQLGHAAGDALLIEAAKRMARCVRNADTVARLGGDEFAIILSELSDGAASAEETARRINATMAEPFGLDQGEALVAVSIGIAIYPVDGEDLPALKLQADRALYAAKAAGRNTYRLAAQSA